jgi:hypothetical protein
MAIKDRQPMSFALVSVIYTLGLLLGMMALLEVGRRIGLRRMAEDPEGARAGIGTIEGALLALLGLLIAFSFSGAAARFDARRHQIVDEANEISSAYMLVDVLPPKPRLRSKIDFASMSIRGSMRITRCRTSPLPKSSSSDPKRSRTTSGGRPSRPHVKPGISRSRC